MDLTTIAHDTDPKSSLADPRGIGQSGVNKDQDLVDNVKVKLGNITRGSPPPGIPAPGKKVK